MERVGEPTTGCLRSFPPGIEHQAPAYDLPLILVEAREDTLPLADWLEERKVTAFTSAGIRVYV